MAENEKAKPAESEKLSTESAAQKVPQAAPQQAAPQQAPVAGQQKK